MTSVPASRAPIDWRSVFMLPPRRMFSAAELARALPEPLSRTVVWSAIVNVALPVMLVLGILGYRNPLPYVLLAAVLAAVLIAAGLAAWRNPTGWVARSVPWVVPVLAAASAFFIQGAEKVDRAAGTALVMLLTIAGLGLWMVVVHRHQYVQMRLAELDERERAVEMARRLAAAQLEPHFLFNTLASLQHWVQTRDERAGPLLTSLTGYLRATLPMFARPTLALADEAEAVRRYLEVMQARLGARLRVQIDIDPALATLPLPPGLMLTLVENAIEHGVEPLIEGGEVSVRAHTDGGSAVLTVRDSGPGPAPGTTDGVGLANCRERLALIHGERASITLGTAPGGGGLATVRLPLENSR